MNFSLLLLGASLGLMDGILNPCALAVLFFLVAYLLAIGSRKKYLSIALTYSFTIFFIYSLFMYGVLSLILLIGYLYLIKFVLGGVIVIAGSIELKDFFFYGKLISLSIPKKAKQPIQKLIKYATIPSTILLGFLVTLVEIPCAGAFPLSYVAILSKSVSGIASLPYIFWYNLFFIFPLIFLIIAFYLGLARIEKAERFRLKVRKFMRLLSGIILISIGLLLLVGWI